MYVRIPALVPIVGVGGVELNEQRLADPQAAAHARQRRVQRLDNQHGKTTVVYARILTVAANPALSNTNVHVLKYKRNKERYILLQPELGDAATKSLCSPASLVLAVGTSVIVSRLTGAPERCDRRTVWRLCLAPSRRTTYVEVMMSVQHV